MLKFKQKDANGRFIKARQERRSSNHDKYSRRDYSAYWFAFIIIIGALYIIFKTLGYLK